MYKAPAVNIHEVVSLRNRLARVTKTIVFKEKIPNSHLLCFLPVRSTTTLTAIIMAQTIRRKETQGKKAVATGKECRIFQ